MGADQEDQMVSMMTPPNELKDLLATDLVGVFYERLQLFVFLFPQFPFFFRSRPCTFMGSQYHSVWSLIIFLNLFSLSLHIDPRRPNTYDPPCFRPFLFPKGEPVGPNSLTIEGREARYPTNHHHQPKISLSHLLKPQPSSIPSGTSAINPLRTPLSLLLFPKPPSLTQFRSKTLVALFFPSASMEFWGEISTAIVSQASLLSSVDHVCLHMFHVWTVNDFVQVAERKRLKKF